MANRFLSNIRINDAYTLPASDGSSGQVITTDGSGNLSFVDPTSGAATTALSLNVTVKNVSGGSLAKGTIVHAAPTATPPSGNVVEVIAADYDTSTSMPAIGVLNETIANEAEGQAIMFGAVSGIDTSSFSAGDELWVGNNGAFTNTKPATAGQLIQKIAVVIKSHATAGLIKVFGAGRTNDVPLPLYIDNTNQRVGIGTALPGNRLTVFASAGQATTLANSISNAALYINSDTVNGSNNIRIGESGNGSYFLQVSNSAGTTPYDINLAPFGGNIGIGTVDAKQKLHVSGGTTSGDVTKVVIGATGGNAESYLYLAENFSGNDVNYGFSFVADGNSSNNLLIKRHRNSTSGSTVITVNRDNDDVSFAGNVIIGSALKGPSTFYIDPSPDDTGQPGGATTDTGTVVILGDLQVTGTTTTIDSTTLNIGDKNIVLAKDATTAAEAVGAGITIGGVNATFTYNSNDLFEFSKWITAGKFIGDVQGNVTGSASLNVLKAGDTMTGDLDFDDNVSIKLGTGNDMTIYHSSTHSFIRQLGTGNLYIDQASDGQNITFRNDDGSGGLANYFVIQGSAQKNVFHQNVDITSGNLQVGGTTVIDSSRNLSAVQGDFTGNVNIVKANVGVITNYSSASIEAIDAQLDIISSSSGTWGSAINLVEGASTTANTDVWSIARHTTGGSGDSGLYFNFGTGNQHDNSNRVKFSSSGSITAQGSINSDGLVIDNVTWNSNKVRIEGDSPNIEFRDTSASTHWFQVGANSSSFYVLHDSNRDGTFEGSYPLRLDSTNSTGELYGSRIFADNYHPNADKWTNARTLTLTGDVTGTSAAFDGSGNISIATTVNDSNLLKKYTGTSTADNTGYTTAFTVAGDNLSSSIRFSAQGTTGSVVVANLIDLVVNHSQDIMIKAQSGVYTRLYVKVVSNNNEDFAVELKTNSSNTVTLNIEVVCYGSETVTFASSHSFTGASLEHDCAPGYTYSGTGGAEADIKTNGDISAGGRVYVGTGGGNFYNDTSSRVRIDQDFYTNNSNTYLYANNLYLGNTSGDNVHVRGNTIFGNNWEIDTAGKAQFSGALKITESGTAQHILIGNQDSGGVNKPAMIRGVNGYIHIGYGNSWSGEGGTFTSQLTFANGAAYFEEGAVEFGQYGTTNGGRLYINGTTANKRAIIQCTNGNLHIDSENAHSLYLNYYEGSTSNVIFGTGNGGAAAQVNSDGSARFPIYYDYNNTNYYVDPASRSQLTSTNISLNDATALSDGTFDVSKSIKGGIHFTNGSGTGTANGYQASITFMGSSSAESQAGMYVHNNNSSGTYMAFATANNYSNGPQIALRIDNVGKVFADRNFIQSNTDMRAPIFYDSDNTSYYVNPQGTSKIAILLVEDQIRTGNGQQLVLNAGESHVYATGQTGENVYVNAESGLQVNSSPDNWSSGWAGRNTVTINDPAGNSYFPGRVQASEFYTAGKVIHTGDTDTYTEFNAADTWRVVVGGSQKLVVNSSSVSVSNATLSHQGITMSSGTNVDQIYEAAMSFQLTADTWTDTGINSSDLATGTYVVQVFVSDHNAGGGHYSEYYSGTMSWYAANTNSTNTDEIVLHNAGHASNSSHLQLRTQRHGSGGDDLMLQVKQNFSHSTALDGTSGKQMTFKFRRLI